MRWLTGGAATLSLLAACGGGGSQTSDPGAGSLPVVASSCDGSCASAATFLTVADVEKVLAQAIAEAQARSVRATIAVSDRSGNILAVYRMSGAAANISISSGRIPAVSGGLEGVNIVPASLAAIAKAITPAYLSSEGNAFSTRTAGQIVQEHFNPGELLAPAGPLFGVQFSQLPCSDLMNRTSGTGVGPGPMRSPLGLAADPGGLPLYKAGTPVGGVGVIADGVYGLDVDISDRDLSSDELLAVAASFGFAAPQDRRADRITADGKTLRFSDAEIADLAANPAAAPAWVTLAATLGALVPVTGYSSGAAILAGLPFGTAASGVRADVLDYPGLDAFVLVDTANNERFRPRAGTEVTGAMSVAEVRALLRSALGVANRSRAQIRRPLSGPARVSVSIVDTAGTILGIVRARDAPMFGVDVALQKARTAAFLSSSQAAGLLAAQPDAVFLSGGLTVLRRQPLAAYTSSLRGFLGLANALADGQVAFSARAAGNLARPFFPDGVDNQPPGPLGRAFGNWSPFNTGLQLELVYNAVIRHVAFVAGASADVAGNCTGVAGFDSGFATSPATLALANGLQIFPGGIPLYRGRQLVGGIGVSGDGVDQDDMIALLGVSETGQAGLGNAPLDLRSDTLVPQGSRLRYVACPQAPFLNSNEQDPCNGK